LARREFFGRSLEFLARQRSRPERLRNDTNAGTIHQLREIQRRGDDPRARLDAIMKLYQDSDLNPLKSCAWGLAPAIALQIPMVWSPLNQSLPDRIAGIIVVEA
jgi:hypothetical protein